MHSICVRREDGGGDRDAGQCCWKPGYEVVSIETI